MSSENSVRLRTRPTRQNTSCIEADAVSPPASLLRLEYRAIADLRLSPVQVRKHTRKKLNTLKKSRDRVGDLNALVTTEDGEVLDGHARFAIAKADGRETLPCIIVANRSPALRTVARLALNRMQETGVEYDMPNLADACRQVLAFDPTLIDATGFTMAEVDGALFKVMVPAPAEVAERPLPTPVTRLGDVWKVGRHWILCGNARRQDTYVRLLGSAPADMILADPPYCGRSREISSTHGRSSKARI